MNTIRELTIDELDAVSGGTGKHIDNVEIETFGGSSGPTPASAWNACLNGCGYPSMA